MLIHLESGVCEIGAECDQIDSLAYSYHESEEYTNGCAHIIGISAWIARKGFVISVTCFSMWRAMPAISSCWEQALEN